MVLRSASKSYGDVRALRDVDLRVDRGEVLALVGANGAGKTTILSLAAGLRRPDGGSVTVFGLDPAPRTADVRSMIGVAQQDLAIYPSLTVRENLDLFGDLRGVRSRSAGGQSSGEVAVAFGLGGTLGRRAGALSGGMQRRLHVALAFLGPPALLLLDEPTAGLDIDGRSELLRAVADAAAAGAAVVYSTNRLDEAEDLGRNVAILDRGSVVAYGTVAELVAAHADEPALGQRGLQTVFLALTGRRYEPAPLGDDRRR